MTRPLGRRGLLLAAAAASASTLLPKRRATAQEPPGRYLFAIGALGGASILDSFLPLAEDASTEARALTSFAPALIETVAGVDLRCVAPLTEEITGPPPYAASYRQRTFLERHGPDTAVMTLDHSSVNHNVGQRRAMNGNGVNSGRTLLEAVAARHGQGLPLAAVNMMAGEFAAPGWDPSLPAHAQQVTVADARYFALGTHASLGLPIAVDHEQLLSARAIRARLDSESAFATSFEHVAGRRRFLALRERANELEASGIATEVGLLDLPGLERSPELTRIRELLPNFETDPFEAQAALAFLLAKSGGSCALGISPSDALALEGIGAERGVSNPALAFDSSHNTHRVGQHVMWSRLLRVTDALITLLKGAEDLLQPGSSLWDRSLVYMPTEFGRTRRRPAGSTRFGTGHFQNNGVVLVSPLIQGGRAYGGVDPATALTFGFERNTGEPRPSTHMSIEDVYGVVCEALEVEYENRGSTPSMLR
ncbi:MAG: hypothetical protein AB8H86_34110 [Polyangiales bacterium]